MYLIHVVARRSSIGDVLDSTTSRNGSGPEDWNIQDVALPLQR